MPPGSAKSSYASVLFPSWYIGKHPGKNIIAVSHTTRLAERFGRQVRNLVKEPAYQELWGDILSSDSKAAGRWATSEGGEYYAAGAGSAIVGFRADIAILDDVVAGREAADSLLARNKLYEWYISDCWSRLKPTGAVVIIMQRWHDDDLAGRLLADADKGGETWEVIKFPMEAEEDDILGRSQGELLWPEHFTEAMLAQAKRDTRAWLALYQQRPRPEVGGEFLRDWIEYYKNAPSMQQLNRYIFVDPANSKKITQDADFTAIWVVGLGHDENIYILDIVRDRLNLTERTELLFDLHRKWRPLDVIYESYGMQADIDHIKSSQEMEQYRFKVTPIGGSLKKQDRIRRLIPLFESHRLWFPRTLNRTGTDNVMRDLIHEFVEEEYLPFPATIRHDDMLDALSRLLDVHLRWPGKVVSIAPDSRVGSHSGWMGS